MKTKKLLETMAAILCGATLAMGSAAQAAPLTMLPLHNASVTASYNGQGAGMLGVEHDFALEAGSNFSHIDPNGFPEPEFISADYRFIVDLSESGLLTVYANGDIAPGNASMQFDFGDTLGAALGAFTLVDTQAIGGLPLLSLLGSNAIGIDLSGVSWNSNFASFSAQLDAVAPAAVPEPASAALLLAGLAGMGLAGVTRTGRR